METCGHKMNSTQSLKFGVSCRLLYASPYDGMHNNQFVLKRSDKLDVDPRRDDDASPMSSYRVLVETYLNDFISLAKVKI